MSMGSRWIRDAVKAGVASSTLMRKEQRSGVEQCEYFVKMDLNSLTSSSCKQRAAEK
jgi:hypothetical protein